MRNNLVNKYVPLVQTKPDLIIASDDESPVTPEMLNKKASEYSKVFLELGSGSGNHLIEQAARDPKSLWIGFEIRFKRTFRTAEKAEKIGVTNILAVRDSALNVRQYFSPQSIDGLFVNFPDPWAKRRWNKNRLMREPFLTAALSLIKPDGFFSYKTDHKESFEELVSLMEKHTEGQIVEKSLDLYSNPGLLEGNVATEFESLFKNQKLPIYYLKFKMAI